MNTQKQLGFTPLLAIIIILGIVIIGGGIYLYQIYQKSSLGPVACTLEAKVCSDGTTVGRTGPNCEFAKCPEIEDETTNWQTYRNEEYGFEVKLPPELKGGGDKEFWGSYGHSSINLIIKVVPTQDFSILHPGWNLLHRTRVINRMNVNEYYNESNKFIYFPLKNSKKEQVEIFAEIGFGNTDQNLERILSTFRFLE